MVLNRLSKQKLIIKKARKHQFRVGLFAFSLTFSTLFLASITVFASTPISENYSSDGKLSLGSIVSLKSGTTDQVVASTNNNVNSLLGIVIDAGNSALSISSGRDNEVQVATSGTIDILVSDVNGKISYGDQITASPIAGVGMKANSNVRVIGTAQGDLIGSAGSKETPYTDSDGLKHTALIGQVPIIVNVAYFSKEQEKTIIPQAIQNVANALAGRSVSSLPILISAGIFVITMIVVVSIIFSMINGSIISVGRNPMSQSAIYRGIIQLSALVLAIISVAIISIYLVLTRM